MSDVVNDHDASDLAAARAGDRHAFARLYDRHAAVILSLCRRLGASSADAEDAMQETFIRAHGLLGRLNGTTDLRPWLYAIARRICSERLRAFRRRASHEQTARQHQIERGAETSEPSERDEALSRLDDALAQLDERQRLAIHLYYLDADPVTAAASALGLSRSGYYKLLQTARARLSELMREVSHHDRAR